jgi:hypothetical protein
MLGGESPPASGRDCFRVECAADEDCCASFTPDPSCDFYEDACTADPADCAAFRLLCQCNRRCDAERCVAVAPSCSADSDCPAFSSPFCVSDRCASCREHGDCAGEGARCVEGMCVDPCTADEQCPLLHRCEAGSCAPSGCSSDRECAFVLGDAEARCLDSDCIVACSDDAECDVDAFEICHEERCVFAGCETDAECRAYLDIAEDPGAARAVCR